MSESTSTTTSSEGLGEEGANIVTVHVWNSTGNDIEHNDAGANGGYGGYGGLVVDGARGDTVVDNVAVSARRLISGYRPLPLLRLLSVISDSTLPFFPRAGLHRLLQHAQQYGDRKCGRRPDGGSQQQLGRTLGDGC
jgi:hypothetical protein